MKFTILDCLKLSAFNKAVMLAGYKSAGVPIKKVTVLETMERDEILKYCSEKNQLMITSFSPIKEDIDKQCQVIEALSDSENIGLVIVRVGHVVKEIDQKLIRTAENLDFPLIIIEEEELKVSELIEAINTKLFYGEKTNLQNKLINNSIYHLLNFEKYGGFQMALRGAAIENDYQVVIVSKNFNPVFSVETRHTTSISEVVEAWRNKYQEGVYSMKDINGILTYWGTITIDGEQNFIIIVDNNDQYTGEEVSKLAEIIEIASAMWKFTPEKDSKAEIIKALRRNNRSLAYTLNKDVGLDEKNILSVFYSRNVEVADMEEAVVEFSKEGFNVMWIQEEKDAYGFIMSKERATKKHKEEERKLCIEFYGTLKQDRKARVFHVTGVDGLESVADAYQIINETSHFVESVYPHKRVFSKFELSLVRNCVGMEIQGSLIKKTYLDLLTPLKELGKVKEKQLLETLETFVLDSGLNSNKTAEAMGVHANTVQYRLRRIDDLLGGEITGNRMVPSLTIALALRRLEKDR